MEFRKVLALRGPSIWANFPVLEAWVDLGDLDKPSNEFPGFNDRLMAWMPTMIEHRCSIGQRGGFFQRLRNGTYLGHILEHVTLELQSLAGTEVGFGKARETSEKGVYKVIIEYVEETVGRECLAVARELCVAAVFDRPFDVAAEIERLRNLAHEVCLGPSTRAIVEAVKARGIPYRRLSTDSLVLFGHGRKQRRIQAAETDRTSAIAEAIAQDKEMTRMLLRAVGRTATKGAAWPQIYRPASRSFVHSARLGRRASTFWSRSSPPGTTTGCWSWATAWSLPPGASLPMCWAMESIASPRWSIR